MYRKKITVFLGFNSTHSFRHHWGVVECVLHGEGGTAIGFLRKNEDKMNQDSDTEKRV